MSVFVLAAGGTGGHMTPAHALAAELIGRGHRVALVTDARGAKIPGLFKDVATHVLPAGRVSGGPLGWLRAARGIWAGRTTALKLLRELKPAAVIGFGGYPALPSLLAASKLKIPSAVHEQNAVLGRVNRAMGPRVDAVATSYPNVRRLSDALKRKTHLVGNPVREEVLALRDQPYSPLDDELRVLVTGGSLGATVLSEVVPNALARLRPELRAKLRVVHQARAEDIEQVRARYAELGIAAEAATYLIDLPARIGWSHLVIARAGASTVAELTVIGRPAILVPLPIATDDHQSFNVAEMVAAGGGVAIAQPMFTPERVAEAIEAMDLADAARGAKGCGRPDAARDLADLVESIAR